MGYEAVCGLCSLCLTLLFPYKDEALIGVFGSTGAWPKKGREQGSMNSKFGSLGARDFLGKSFKNFMLFS